MLAALLAASLAGPALKAQTASPPPPLSAQDREAIVASFAQALRQRYVFPDVAERAANAISAALAAGNYDAIPEASAFTARLSSDVAAIAHDKHLAVWSGGSSPPPPANASPVPRSEAGVVRADRLANGIGYLQLTAFLRKPWFRGVIDRAMVGLEGSRALIIDDRANHGGDPASVAYLISFLVAQGQPINDIVSRTQGTANFSRESFRAVHTPVSFVGVPVYVLTSHETFSAGEEFAYDLKALRRATLIGEGTAGGANPTMGVDLGHGAMAMIPFGRAENPATHGNWEGHGVQPDIAAPEADALKVALEQLGQKPAMTIEQASVKQLFAPRISPNPASAERLRQTIASYVSGHPDYTAMAPDFAAEVREEASDLQSMLSALGPVKSIRFIEVDRAGRDTVEVTFTHGVRIMTIALGSDGKIVFQSAPMMPSPGT